MLYFMVILYLINNVLEWHARVLKILDLAIIPICTITFLKFSTGRPVPPLKSPMDLLIIIGFPPGISTYIAMCIYVYLSSICEFL